MLTAKGIVKLSIVVFGEFFANLKLHLIQVCKTALEDDLCRPRQFDTLRKWAGKNKHRTKAEYQPT